MFDQEIASSWARIGYVVISAFGMLGGTITYVRLSGLRSFSKMSSFDFAVTVAFGSLLASTSMSQSSLIDGLVACGSLLGVQILIALGRSRFGLSEVVDNQPLLLMRHGRLLKENLAKSRVTENDIRAKLREANVFNYDQVEAVVLETTGDVSVLHSSGSETFDDALLADVRH